MICISKPEARYSGGNGATLISSPVPFIAGLRPEETLRSGPVHDSASPGFRSSQASDGGLTSKCSYPLIVQEIQIHFFKAAYSGEREAPCFYSLHQARSPSSDRSDKKSGSTSMACRYHGTIATFSESGHCRDPPGHAFASRGPSRDGRQVHFKGIIVKTVSIMRRNSAFCASPIVQRHL